MVDVGGGKGLACRSVAKHFPDMTFIVQDLADTAKAGQGQLPPEFKDRISFMTHDFFTAQPVKDADVYSFRAIFHNWPDRYCVKILQSLIPALKKGAKVIIWGPFASAPLTSPPWQERLMRGSNLRMKLLFNSTDRGASEWTPLFAEADPRFKVLGVRAQAREAGSSAAAMIATIEAVWMG